MKESNKINKSTLSESSTVADATGAAIQGAKMNERPLLTTKPDNNPAPPAGKECGLDAKLEGEPKSLGNVTSEQAITEQRKEDKEYLRVKRKAAQRAWTLMYDGAHNGSQSYALVDQYDLTRGEHLTLEQA